MSLQHLFHRSELEKSGWLRRRLAGDQKLLSDNSMVEVAPNIFRSTKTQKRWTLFDWGLVGDNYVTELKPLQ